MVTAASLSAGGPPDVGKARDIRKVGNWFRDGDDRWVILRGVNFGARSKVSPYMPIDAGLGEDGAVLADLDLLQRAGCNVVRLLVIWNAFERDRRRDGEALSEEAIQKLRTLNSIVVELHRRGMLVLVDFHQDIVNEKYGGDGFPNWAIAGGLSNWHGRPVDNAGWSTRYYLSQGVRKSLSGFWEDRDGVQTHMLETMRLVAGFFRDEGTLATAILGFEPFNEPHQGSTSSYEFETELLPRYYRRALEAVGEDAGFLFVEPRVDWTTYGLIDQRWPLPFFTTRPQTHLKTCGNVPDERLVLSFHYYDPWTIMNGRKSPAHKWGSRIPLLGAWIARQRARSQAAWPATFALLRDAALARHAIPFLTEFGIDRDVEGGPELLMNLQFAQVDRLLLNSTYWNFDLYNDRKNGDGWNHENFSLLGPKQDDGRTKLLDVFARPYAMRSSAEPKEMSYEPLTRHFSLTLEGEPVTTEPTLVFVPRAAHFADGFVVHTSGRPAEWDEKTSMVRWRLTAGSTHRLELRPAYAGPPPAVGAGTWFVKEVLALADSA